MLGAAAGASNFLHAGLGTGERASRQSVGWGDGVYKSIDGGRTWTPPIRLQTSPFLNISTLVRAPPLPLADGFDPTGDWKCRTLKAGGGITAEWQAHEAFVLSTLRISADDVVAMISNDADA